MPISRETFPVGPPEPPREFAWFHVVLTTYGTWLPGDPRGFRTRHHRQHVDGDYKSPPTEDYSAKFKYSTSVLKQPPVHVETGLQPILGRAIVERLLKLGAFVLAAAVIETHVHVLVKIPTDQTRHWVGLAKKHAWFELRNAGYRIKLWAKRAKFTPIEDRKHLKNCLRYIVAHHRQGAWVWIWEGLSNALVDDLTSEKSTRR